MSLADLAGQEALKDDRETFTVVIGCWASGLDGDVDANDNDIITDNSSAYAQYEELLQNVSRRIGDANRYGLIGPNGTRNSTLLKLLASRKIPRPKNTDLVLVEHEVIGDERSVLETVVSANVELVKLCAKVAALRNSSFNVVGNDNNVDDDAGNKLAELYERLQVIESDAIKVRASKILAGLGFTKDMQDQATGSFSASWRTRISLARALFVQPTILLLDEPTNHLDLRAVLWLGEYLRRWKKTLLVVTDDRDFLNTVCNEIIQVRDEKLFFNHGKFCEFESGYEDYRKLMNKKYEIFDKQIKAAKRNARSSVQLEKLKARGQFAAAKETVKYKADRKDNSINFQFPEPTEVTPPLLQLIDVSFGYPDQEDFRLSKVVLGIDMGTRLAIFGPDGAGQSTLLKLLAGDLVPTEGEARKSQKLRIGWYSQHFVDVLTTEETAVQYLLRLHPDQEGLSKQKAVRAKLLKFGLPSHNHLTPIAELCGWQKARVVFTSISMSKPHILILDEPTKYLDMQSVDALANAIDEFPGGVVLVSRDSRLISQVCAVEGKSEIWVVENGTVEAFPGTFEQLKEGIQREIKAEVDAIKSLAFQGMSREPKSSTEHGGAIETEWLSTCQAILRAEESMQRQQFNY